MASTLKNSKDLSTGPNSLEETKKQLAQKSHQADILWASKYDKQKRNLYILFVIGVVLLSIAAYRYKHRND